MSDYKTGSMEKASETSSTNDGSRAATPVDTEPERRAIRKLDWTILPVMAMFYFLSFLDRANIGNARVAGLQKGLHLTDRQYQICVTVTYVPYIAAELPANLLLRKIGPRLLMPSLLTIWGVMVVLEGFVSSFTGLVIVRFFLGLVEGPMFPGIVLYLSGFYTRKELSLRIALFFSSASLSGAFSGLLAAAIAKMNGLGGKPGWSWIFIIEGIFSVLMGLLGFFLVPSTPRESKFLTDDQKDLIMARLERDRPSIRPSDKFGFKEVMRSLLSPHVISLFVMFFLAGTTLYGLALFTPSIVNQYGFSPNKTQLLSVGPFAAAFFLTLITAYFSDKMKSRGVVTAAIGVLSVIGWALNLASTNKFMSYGALYLMIPGVYALSPILSAWMANNSEPYYRRATSVALGFIATNSGGILSTWRFPTKEGPKFRKTTIMNLTFSCFIVVASLANVFYLMRKNKQKRTAEYRQKMLAKYSDAKTPDGGVEAWMELGDKHPDFVYAL